MKRCDLVNLLKKLSKINISDYEISSLLDLDERILIKLSYYQEEDLEKAIRMVNIMADAHINNEEIMECLDIYRTYQNTFLEEHLLNLFINGTILKKRIPLKGARILVNSPKDINASYVLEALTSKTLEDLNLTFEIAKIYSEVTNEASLFYISKIIKNEDVAKSGLLKDSIEILKNSPYDFTAKYAYFILINNNTLSFNISLEGARLINRADTLEKAHQASLVLKHLNATKNNIALLGAELILECNPVIAPYLVKILTCDGLIEKGTVLDWVEAFRCVNSSYKASLLYEIFKNNYLKMLDLDLVMANLIVNKDWDRNICILKSKVYDPRQFKLEMEDILSTINAKEQNYEVYLSIVQIINLIMSSAFSISIRVMEPETIEKVDDSYITLLLKEVDKENSHNINVHKLQRQLLKKKPLDYGLGETN